MSRRWYYRDVVTGDLTEFTSQVDTMQESRLTIDAEQGQVSSSEVVVYDPDGDWDSGGHRVVYVTEGAIAAGNDRLWQGYSATREFKRAEPFSGGARSVTITLDDLNTIIDRRVMTGTDSNRSAETDVERIQWLMGTNEFTLIDDATTYVSTASPVNMDAADYRGQRGMDVINDCAQMSGKNVFVLLVWNDPDWSYAFWYDFAASEAFSSDIQISNDPDDTIDSVTIFAPFGDTTMTRDPSRVYARVYANYDGGAILRLNETTRDNFASRDTIASWPNVKSASKARAKADRYLVSIASEEDVIDTTIRVTASQANDVRAGHRIEAKFTHLRPYHEDFTWMRVLEKTAVHVPPDHYDLMLKLSPGSVATPSGTCTTALAGTSSYSSGRVDTGIWDWSAGALGQAIGLTPSSASLIVAVMGVVQHSFEPGPFVSVDLPYTIFGDGTANLGFAGYRANTTSGGTFAGNFTGGDAHYQATVAASIPTASTTPVQEAQQVGSGGTVTFGAPATPGNILVCVSYLLGGYVGTVSGWTTLVTNGSLVDADIIHGISVRISAYCVQAGDTDTFAVPDDARYHASYVSEWTII